MQLKIANQSTEETLEFDLVEFDGDVYLTAKTGEYGFTVLTLKVNDDNQLEFQRAPGIAHDNFHTDEYGRLVEDFDGNLDDDDLYLEDDYDEEDYETGDELYVDSKASGC